MVTWSLPFGGEIRVNPPNKGSSNRTTAMWKSKHIRTGQSGIFKCTATNAAGQGVAQIQIQVVTRTTPQPTGENTPGLPHMTSAENTPGLPRMTSAENAQRLPSMTSAENTPGLPRMTSAGNTPDLPHMTSAGETISSATSMQGRASEVSTESGAVKFEGQPRSGQDTSSILAKNPEDRDLEMKPVHDSEDFRLLQTRSLDGDFTETHVITSSNAAVPDRDMSSTASYVTDEGRVSILLSASVTIVDRDITLPSSPLSTVTIADRDITSAFIVCHDCWS